jgi:hypothetical protein
MTHIVFVPGTMGSQLIMPDGEMVWPPGVDETQFGYDRIEKLLNPGLRVGDVVRNVWCVGVYRPLIATFERMGFHEKGATPGLTLFAYDWRRDLEVLSGQLAARLAQVPGNQDIVIVAHSMGGLISRLVLENPAHVGAPWMARIKMLTTLATPHLGAPLALARILGLDSAMGISGPDFRRMASDARYPSGYQLLPPEGEASCWDAVPAANLAMLNIYDPAVAARLHLDPALLKRAKWVHDSLAKGKRPAHVRYVQFAGVGHSTITRVNAGSKDQNATPAPDAGDGTVPMWSATPLPGQKQTVPGSHMDFFASDAFCAVFYRLFGQSYPVPARAAVPLMRLTLADLVLRAGNPVEVMLIPEAASGRIRGEVTVERTESEKAPWITFRPAQPLAYDGPPVHTLTVALPAMGKPGLYRIGFTGSHAVPDPVIFAAQG